MTLRHVTARHTGTIYRLVTLSHCLIISTKVYYLRTYYHFLKTFCYPTYHIGSCTALHYT